MKFGREARKAREQTGLGVMEAATALSMDRMTLYNLEHAESKPDYTPDPQNVINMSVLYKEPALINTYCKCYCPIGKRLNYILPNKLPRNLTAITVRNMKESEEHVKYLKEFAYQSVSGMDKTHMHKAVKEILEAEYWIETLKEQIIREYGIEELEGLVREVNCEYIDEGLVSI